MEAVKPSGSQFVGITGEDEEDDGFNRDSARLKQILPPEIWLLVAEKVKERRAADLENLTNSSKFFQKLLASQRTTFLFEKVFPLVVQSVWRKEGLEGLPVSDVLRCRGVSKHWNTVIDKLIPEKFQNFGKGSEDNQVVSIRRAFNTILRDNDFHNLFPDLDNEDDLGILPRKKSPLNFLRHFEQTHPINQAKARNPWIWGKIGVTIIPEDDPDVVDYHGFMEGISSVLSKYGSHVTSFSLDSDKHLFFENASMLQKWLLEMPNLKKLILQYEAPADEDGNGDDDIFAEELNYPVPKLEYLENMKIDNLPTPMFNQLIGQNDHVSVLKISKFGQGDYDVFSHSFPNLKKFEMVGCPDDLAEKLGMPQVQWKLESLKLVFYESFKCGALLQMIQNQFANTLVHFALEIGGIRKVEDLEIQDDCRNCRLDLPKLRKICVNFNRNPVCLDFLLPMRHTLEEISASYGYAIPLVYEIVGTSGPIVQYVGFEEKMLQSNIWAIFKNLKRIEVICIKDYRPKSRYYSREDWMLNNLYD